MGAKIISVSADDITYYTLPGSSGELHRQAGSLDDTIFGSTYKSVSPGVINWQVTANAFFKGYAGYLCSIKKIGTSTVMTSEACTLVSGKTYQITSAIKRVVNRGVTLNVLDNAVNQNANVLNVDYLNGKVTFLPSYTVTGPVTITGAYFPLISLGSYMSFNLTQTAAAIKASDLPSLQANGGFDIFRSGGLREVNIQLPSIFVAADAWDTSITARSEYILEINPDGAGAHSARGFFKLMDDKQSGNVGALEEETLQFNLTVPQSLVTQLASATPFGWTHAAGGPLPAAVKTLLTAWETESLVYVKYLPDGVAGWKGPAIVTNISLQGGAESINQFTCAMQGSGARTAI